MNRFIPPKSLFNPIGFDRTKSLDKIIPEYNSFSGYKRVLNTRNPFSRILAAYTDKFYESPSHQHRYGHFWNEARMAEKDEFEIPGNYSASFHAFLRNEQPRLYFIGYCRTSVCNL